MYNTKKEMVAALAEAEEKYKNTLQALNGYEGHWTGRAALANALEYASNQIGELKRSIAMYKENI